MTDDECVRFLQSVLPRLGLRWPGFRRVRRQVCKRIARRWRALELADLDAYRARLESDAAEWDVLDSLCRVTISRFCRDRGVFDALGADVLPGLARRATKRGDRLVRCWSAGCASGEEPYSLALLWSFRIAPKFPTVELEVVATDADAQMLERARRGCYAPGTLRELPAEWGAAAFERRGRWLCLRAPYRAGVAIRRQDIRAAMPDGPFDLVLCRNLAFTYFEAAIQRDVLRGIADRLDKDGYLVIGGHETLPDEGAGFTAEGLPRAVFRTIESRNTSPAEREDVRAVS
jgi:chemotaxis protein methyltransferase CheR